MNCVSAIKTMLDMQNRMNSRVHDAWIEQHFEWYRAVWVECAELMDHVGYKWWKKQNADIGQVHLEVIDIWHFGMSALFEPDSNLESLAVKISIELKNPISEPKDIHTATESLAQYALDHKSFSVKHFSALMMACNLSLEDLYRHYIAKNVLNFFRQDHGYKDGTYIKKWNGKEDNEHLAKLLEGLDSEATDFPEQVYQALTACYPG